MTPYEAFFQLFFRDRSPGRLPLKLCVEVTNRCNLRCTTCPREESGRGFGDMDPELFERLADEVAGEPVLFYPQGFGESFLHPRYPEMLTSLRPRGVRFPVVITNATLLDATRCELLLDAAPKQVIVSLDGGRAETYEAIRRGARFDAVVANVERLFRRRQERDARHPFVSLSLIGTDAVAAEEQAVRTRFAPWLRRTDNVFLCTPITWSGTWPTPGTGLARGEPAVAADEDGRDLPPCRMLYKTLTVFHDGRVTPCTSDHACQLEIGNAREQSLRSLWNGEPLARLRALHGQGRSHEIPLCRGCPEHMP